MTKSHRMAIGSRRGFPTVTITRSPFFPAENVTVLSAVWWVSLAVPLSLTRSAVATFVPSPPRIKIRRLQSVGSPCSKVACGARSANACRYHRHQGRRAVPSAGREESNHAPALWAMDLLFTKGLQVTCSHKEVTAGLLLRRHLPNTVGKSPRKPAVSCCRMRTCRAECL
jgi:hypothetical protein